ncbi:MAG: hypothetical protein R2792_17940 [Saprospiraceae bacterium]
MKPLLFWLAISALLFSACQNDESGYNKLVLCSDGNVDVYLLYQDTGSLIHSDWLQLKIKNKSQESIFINDISASLEKVLTDSNGKHMPDSNVLRKYSRADLIDAFFDKNSERSGIRIYPNSTFTSSKNLSYILADKEEKTGINTLAFAIDFLYEKGRDFKSISSSSQPFSFYWKPLVEIPKTQQAKRLKTEILSTESFSNQAALIRTLLTDSAVVKYISGDELVEAFMLNSNKSSNTLNRSYLAALQQKGVHSNPQLTTYFLNQLESNSFQDEYLYLYFNEQLFNKLLEPGLKGKQSTPLLLEANARYWSDKEENRKKVYAFLEERTDFSLEMKPTRENMHHWSTVVKEMAISRDERIVQYLLPYLDDETVFYIADRRLSNVNSGLSTTLQVVTPADIPARVCDVAFVSLLRALNLLQPNPGIQPNYTLNSEMENLLESKNTAEFISDLNLRLDYSEAFIQLNKEAKEQLRVLIAQ